MSLITLVLLSTTPIAGLAVLLGIDRFEKYVLDDHSPHLTIDAAIEDPIAVATMATTAPQPTHRAAA